MNTKQNFRVVGRIARRSLMLVSLLAAALALAGVALAQLTAGTQPADAKVVTPAQTTAKATVVPTRRSGRRGSHEGIKVHGHWTIEVRNPDGKLVSHTEFENGLCTTPSSGAQSGYLYGDSIIANLLNGNYVPGPWDIQLGNPAIPTTGNQTPPCGTNSLLPSAQFVLAQSGTGSNNNGPCTLFSVFAATVPCFPTLSPPTLSSSYPIALTLSGSFTVPSGTATTTITAVGTFLGLCQPNVTVSQCLSNAGSGDQLTGTYLAPPQTATPVTVNGGQTVAVTVQLSFS